MQEELEGLVEKYDYFYEVMDNEEKLLELEGT